MERRQFVCLLGLLAGCNATTLAETNDAEETTSARPESSPATATADRTPDLTTTPPTPRSTDTPTPTEESPEPTSEVTDKPTADEVYGTQQLINAEDALTSVVTTFTGEYGSELTDVTASSIEILDSEFELQLALARAQNEYNEAIDFAANQEQRRTADRMARCWTFLRDTIRTQTKVVTAHEYLTRARDAFGRVEPDNSRNAIQNFEIERRRGRSLYRDLLSSSTAEDASVIEAISVPEYQNKTTQLAADIDTYDELGSVLYQFADGIEWLEHAQTEFKRDGTNVPRGRDLAKEAERTLRSVRRDLREMSNNLRDDTTLGPSLNSLQSTASEKIEQAERLHDRMPLSG